MDDSEGDGEACAKEIAEAAADFCADWMTETYEEVVDYSEVWDVSSVEPVSISEIRDDQMILTEGEKIGCFKELLEGKLLDDTFAELYLDIQRKAAQRKYQLRLFKEGVEADDDQ